MDPDGVTPDDPSMADMLPAVERALAAGSPVDLLGLASATLAIVQHPSGQPDGWERARDQVVESVVSSLVGIGSTPALAYATALAGLVPGQGLRQRLRSGLDGADASLPEWLVRLDEARLEGPTIVRDVFDDDEWLLAGVRMVDGGRLAFRVEVDHASEGALVDASLLPTAVEDARTHLRAAAPDAVSIRDISATELRVRYDEAVAAAGLAGDPRRTETWPACRPLVEWALSRPSSASHRS